MTATTVTETALERSPARAALAARIAAREKARQAIEDRQAAARRLVMIGEAAAALAGQLAGAKAQAAAALARHALNPTGRVPKLVEEGRADLLTRLAEAEAQAEAAGPALAIVEGEISAGFAELHRASAAVAAVTRPVVEEQIEALVGEVREITERLLPLMQRVVGARAYAYDLAHTGDPAEREAFIALGNRLDRWMGDLRIDPATPHGGTHAGWTALSQRLTIDADARAA